MRTIWMVQAPVENISITMTVSSQQLILWVSWLRLLAHLGMLSHRFDFGWDLKAHRGIVLTFCVDPVSVQVRQSRLVAHVLYGFWRFLIQQTARPPPPTCLGFRHCCTVCACRARRIATLVVGHRTREENWGRQLGGFGKRFDGWLDTLRNGRIVGCEGLNACVAGDDA